MFISMDKVNFGDWLKLEREKRDWSQSDLARFSGLHRQIINKTESGVSEPALKTFIALAQAFKISPITIFRIAGLLPDGDNASFEDWQFLLNQLPPEEQEEVRKIVEMKIERRQKEELSARSAKFKPKKAG
jgi:transcriptional regulator with XRE-family HTH domain